MIRELAKSMARKTGSGLGHLFGGMSKASEVITSKPGLVGIGLTGIGLTGIGAGIANSAISEIDNTEINDIGTLTNVKKLTSTPTNMLAQGILGAGIGGVLSKSKTGAAIGLGLGLASGLTSGLQMPLATGGILGLAAGATAFRRGGAKGAAIAGALGAFGGAGLGTWRQSEQFQFAMTMKRSDKTTDLQGPEMAQSMVGQVNGPMSFGGGHSRSYSLGASGDLALALHHKRHG